MKFTSTYILNYPNAPLLPQTSAEYGAYFPVPPTPLREGYSFAGWYLDEACTQRCKVFAAPASDDRLLYARWKAPIGNYRAAFLRKRELELRFFAYTQASMDYLNMTSLGVEFLNSYDGLLEASSNPDPQLRGYFEHMSYALEELVQIRDLEERCIPIWNDQMPSLSLCEAPGAGVQACLQDDPGFRPFLIDLRLPEPELAKGTVIISPSLRAGSKEILGPARVLQALGYNCFGIVPRFNTKQPKMSFNPEEMLKNVGKRAAEGEVGFTFQNGYPQEMLDVQRAIRVLRYNAAKLNIDPERFVSLGFSKGNCIHYISSALFDLKPEEVPFSRTDGTALYVDSGYISDEIDAVSAHVAVNFFDYGEMMLCPDRTEPSIYDNRIYTRENYEKGYRFPAVFIAVGNRDNVNFRVAQALYEHNLSRDKLYEIPFEFHVYDKVPHGPAAETTYPNYNLVWQSMDAFCMMNFDRNESHQPRPMFPR